MSINPTTRDPLLNQINEALDFSRAQKGVLQGARKLSKGLRGKRVVFFQSVKNNALMPCESRLESANCLYLEFNKNAPKYRTQPFKMRLHGGRHYTPDAIFIDKAGVPVIQEVKFSGALNCPNVLSLHRKVRDICNNIGVNFHVITEKTLLQHPHYYNLNYIYRGTHISMSDLQMSYALETIGSTPLTLNKLRQRLKQHNFPHVTAEHLLFNGLLDFNGAQKLDIHSMIWVAGDKK
jgi:hypothetical protein